LLLRCPDCNKEYDDSVFTAQLREENERLKEIAGCFCSMCSAAIEGGGWQEGCANCEIERCYKQLAKLTEALRKIKEGTATQNFIGSDGQVYEATDMMTEHVYEIARQALEDGE
jgi:hypothetical protein